MKECNLLVSSWQLNVGVDNVRANLVVAFDAPTSFKEYTSFKIKAKASKVESVQDCLIGLKSTYLESSTFSK